MFPLKSASLPLAAAASLLLSANAFAESPGFGSFRSVEFGADPAAMVDNVRADLSARIPEGSEVGDARAILRAAGAHCRAPNKDGQIRCRYSDIHIEDDIIQDVSWAVNLQTSGDKVIALTVARDQRLD